MSNIDKQALREAAEKASTDNHTQDEWFHYLRCSTPETVLALLDELEKMQAQSSKWCEAFHKAVSVGARYEERIAELQAPAPELKMAHLINKFYERYPLAEFKSDTERSAALGYFMAGAELQCFGEFINYAELMGDE